MIIEAVGVAWIVWALAMLASTDFDKLKREARRTTWAETKSITRRQHSSASTARD